MKTLDLDAYKASERKDFDHRMEQAEKHRNVAGLANTIAQQFEDELSLSVGIAIGFSTIHCVYMDFRCEEDQGIGALRPVLRAIAETRQFEPGQKEEYLDLEWIGWKFKHKEGGASLLARAWYGKSKVCKKVPTGETVPVYTIECEEV